MAPIFSLLVTVLVGICQCMDGTEVITDAGVFTGYEYMPSFFTEKRGTQFLGIPYAEPPTGERRFTKPVKKAPLSEPFNASTFGPSCRQPPMFITNLSEDCLTLNIFVPAITINGSDFAVMIWIHGGGFIFGNSDAADPTNLASFGDVIVVTVNYRLGVFGFLSTGDSASPGNYGLWDQHLAIRWVRDNIHNFGGDSDRITIFGESAGGVSVDFQGMYAGNKGLLKRAIAESGAMTAPWGHGKPTRERTKELGNVFKCPTTSSKDFVDCMRKKSAEELQSAGLNLMTSTYPMFAPVFDGDFIDYNFDTLYGQPQQDTVNRWTDVEYLLGFNNYDGSGEVWDYAPSDEKVNGTSKSYFEDQIIPKIANSLYGDSTAETVLQSVLKYKYTNYKDQSNMERSTQLLKLLTDFYYAIPTINSAQIFKKQSQKKAFLYMFSHEAQFPLFKLRSPGAGHTDELAYIFGFSKIVFSYPSESPINMSTIPEAEMNFSKTMMTYWTNFAKTGNPNMPVTDYIQTEWPEYTLDGQNFLEFGASIDDIEADDHVFADRVAFIMDLLPSIKFPKPKDCPTSKATKLSTHGVLLVTFVLLWCCRT